MRVLQQPAFVLLNRPFSESSWITEVFTRDYGRLALMAKGARRQNSPNRGILLPFLPLLISWSGRGEVPTLTGAEIQRDVDHSLAHDLQGDTLISAFYCNELVSYLVHRHDPHPQLFDAYRSVIGEFYSPDQTSISGLLRGFEQTVISETGYAVNFAYEADDKTPVEVQNSYLFHAGEGFRVCSNQQFGAVNGRVLLNLAGELDAPLNEAEIAQSKRVMRAILSQSLGAKKIHSRGLFLRPRSVSQPG